MAALTNQLNKIPKQQPETVGFGHFRYDIQSCAPMHKTSLKITPHLLLHHTADTIYIIPTVNCHTRPILHLKTRMWQNTSPISLGEREQCRSHYQGKHRQRGAKAAVPVRSNRCRLPLCAAGLNGPRAEQMRCFYMSVWPLQRRGTTNKASR